ncbi:hypothetical protein [Silanimonas sp.]|jgi:hypothetical protein|uniref:hypothetical protein n=1 Tax=Silanimonas sp. TaxID=1929290 RepID=UPI0037C9F3CB
MRTFWPVASINLALATVFALSALWVTFNPASGCTVDGQPCVSLGIGTLALFIGGPTLALLLVVVVGARVRHHSPKLALAIVGTPPLILAGYVLANILGSWAR